MSRKEDIKNKNQRCEMPAGASDAMENHHNVIHQQLKDPQCKNMISSSSQAQETH